jgi:hypothetical protein
MTEQIPTQPFDEPAGDIGDQAQMLQMAEEQAAIEAALRGDVDGSDALDERATLIDNLEGPETIDAEGADSSDDPVYAGGDYSGDPEALAASEAQERVGMSAPDADADDEDVLLADIEPVDDSTEAEDIDALIDVLPPTHDPDDPQDPDGYGVPPASN